MRDKPNLERKDQDRATHLSRIEGLLGAFRSEQVRWLMDREKKIEKDSRMSEEAFKQLLTKVVRQEAERSVIISELSRKNGGTIGELASSSGIPQKSILRHIIALMKRGSVAVAGEKDDEYLFTATKTPE